ncbi:MAG TPA: 23S rRNA (cytidine(2498)-2'-O)-methyltransferase RlmM, partial [Myxococcaceae bacterium]|nr:23S rRNA (cytidine(2498)-2'-O)-methyltransferase RlmM [Myxococcaceae bacterium]
LYEELAWGGARPSLLGPALLDAEPKAELQPAFGRAGFWVLAVIDGPRGTSEPARAAELLRRYARGRPIHVQAWVPDAAAYQGLTADVEAWGAQVTAALPAAERLTQAREARERGATLGQLCLLSPTLAVVGTVSAREAVSLAPGGRQRMRRGPDAPSRAAMKLDEALETLGVGPDKGDLCVDLGAAPGGWTQRLLERGAKVVAVDPGPLRRDLAAHPKVQHFKESAFHYTPEAPADWLFCDMAWRPLEVAQLLAKWARSGWADALCANFKLPMKDKNPLLFRVRATLADAGWRRLAIRQLYHDRDEVTVTAWRR